MTGEPVTLAKVAKHWPGAPTAALSNVSLKIAAGSFTVLLGPSGCGKSTCLRIIAGLETPTSGTVAIGGRDVTAVAPADRGVAMVFQSYALFPHLSVAENILFGLRARRVPAGERRARLARAADILGIGRLLSRRPSQLSGGQQQRVALGRAIVAEAPVCLLDEPLSNLDAQLRAEMRAELLSLQRRLGLTMVLVTHDQMEAMSMADQVVLLRDGRIEQDAAPGEMYEHPATSFAARFIGMPPMNLLETMRRGDALVLPGSGSVLATTKAAPENILVGVRPEHLALADEGVPALVAGAEYLGADTVLACTLVDGQVIMARLPGRVTPPPGTAIHLALPPGEPTLFDAATGRRLLSRP